METGLTTEDQAKRDEWLNRCEGRPFLNMTYCGREVTIADVARWLRAALQDKTKE